MRILYYCWNENSSYDIMDAFSKLKIEYKKIDVACQDYDEDSGLEEVFLHELEIADYDAIFTFDYFPVISQIAKKKGSKYIAWVYDCPHFTLYSETIINSCNYLFIFDRNLAQEVKLMGAKNVVHMPLAVNVSRLDEMPIPSLQYDVSFVGSLYEENLFDRIKILPEYIKGYLNAIICAQQRIWGYNFIKDMLTPDIVQQLDRYVSLQENSQYRWTHQILYADMINKKITSMDRTVYLESVTDFFTLDLFTGSNIKKCLKAKKHGSISYITQMPQVFRQSKININISLRSITSGIPLRCLDIMGAGGFLLTNYQPELCEYFEEGKDFIYYEDVGDMLQKIDYFLKHEQERKEIARNGYEKVKANFNYEKKVKEILEIASKG